MNMIVLNFALLMLAGPMQPNWASQLSDQQKAERLATFLSGRDGANRLVTIGALTMPEYDNAAADLILMGEPALPTIGREISAIEEGAAKPTAGFEWLVAAYATIKRQNSYGRLEQILGNPRLTDHRRSVAHAIAIALRLTSYRLAEDGPAPPSQTPFGQLPEEALGKFLVAWVRGDTPSLLDAISARGEDPLPKLEALRTELRGHRILRPNTGIGVRLVSPGPIWGWEIPRQGRHVRYTERYETDVELFVTNKSCGTVHVQFVNTTYKPSVIAFDNHYVVANDDLEPMIRLAASCSTLWE